MWPKSWRWPWVEEERLVAARGKGGVAGLGVERRAWAAKFGRGGSLWRALGAGLVAALRWWTIRSGLAMAVSRCRPLCGGLSVPVSQCQTLSGKSCEQG